MLVITRQANESVVIGDDTRLTVRAIRGQHVVLQVVRGAVDAAAQAPIENVTLRQDDGHRFSPDVVVTVVHVRPDRVRLGFSVPRAVPVYRQEIYEEARKDRNRPR